MSVLVFLILPVLIILYSIYFYSKVKKFPKGPTPLPFIGNLLQLPKDRLHEYFDEQSKIYGPCYTVWLPRPMVVLADYDHIKEAFINLGDKFTYRIHQAPESLLQPHDNTGILIADGDVWRFQRRTSLKILRDFGLGKSLMEEQVTRSTREMLLQLSEIKNKKDVDIFWPIQLCVGNVINESLFGYHYSYKNCEKFQNFVGIVNDHLKMIRDKSCLILSSYPWMKHAPIIGERGYHRVKRNIDLYQKFIEDEVRQQISNYDVDSEPENFVHAYLKTTKTDGTDPEHFNNLCASVLDFWLAGMETTSNSLRWHIAYMLKYPEVQEKVRQEIHNVIGTSRLPTMADKPNLPYTQAVTYEVLRHSNMIPLLGSHCNVEESKIFEHTLPAGTMVSAQLYSVLKNDENFDSPLVFNPSRYLEDNGKTFKKTLIDRTIIFSVGKRSCVGEGLARMELFLIFSALLQKYEFIPNHNIDLYPNDSSVLTAKPYKCTIVEQF